MPRFTFNRRELERRLERLGQAEQAAFAALCAERLLSYYASFSAAERWGDVQLLRNAVEAVWASVRGQPLARGEYEQLLAEIDRVTPDTEEFSNPMVSRALDAAVAVAGAVALSIKPSAREAADVAQVTLDAAFGIAQADANSDPGQPHLADLEQLQRLFETAPVKHELEIQAKSLADLDSGAPRVDIEGLRSRYAAV